MEKVLKLYTYVDGVNDTPFPNEEQQVITSDFRSDYKRMGGVPTISCTIMHPLCLDKLWTDNVYATFNGEKFFIKQVPTSSYDNTDARYKHELELVSERIILDNVYVYDVVTSDTTNDKPVSNSSKFVFFGTIHEFAERLNYSLQYSGLDYSVVVDNGISSEGKMVSFEDQFFSNAIQEAYNTYEIPYYFVGKVIHIGFTDNAITHTFKYGQDESLLSIQKQNANYKVVNRVTGVGSADNIPYYYPNDYESKEEVEANGGTWINPQANLMPSIYRESLGKERFYKALNETYINPQTDSYYYFENPFIDGKPKEHIVNFEDIKPSIVGMTNSNGLRIDMFSEFAYDLNDNDETDEEGNYLHPYFFGKLRKFDGEFGFNLFDHAIDESEMVISMTSGSCGACEFVIGVDEDTQKNTVQVDEYGNLLRDSNGNIRFGSPQDRQNDTQNYEVWIALKKDINTFGVIMPNATNNYKPSTNDTFVILHIDLPKAYILAAEDKLKEELIKYMAMNNSEKFNFSITFSRIFFAENPDILAQLNENARIQIEYDNELYELYVSSYSYNMSSDKPLPEIKVELSDTLTVAQNALQTAISEVKHDIMSSVGSIDWLQQGLRYFLRKDTNDRTRGKLSSDVAFEVGKFVAGASGAIIQVDKNTGQTVAELDKLYVRMKAYFETLEIINVNSVGGKMILSPAGSVTCLGVEELEDAYRCYFLGEQDGEVIENRFEANDQAFSQMFNAKVGVSNKVSNHYYWRLVTSVSEDVVDYNNQKCHYIDLSKTDCDTDSDIPKAGDVINQRGSRVDTDRMNFIEFSSVGVNAPYITLFQGVNSYSLVGKEYVSYGYDQSTGKAYMNVYGDMYVGDRNETSYMRYTQEGGLEIKGKLSVGTTLGGKDLQEMINASSPEGYQEFVDSVTKTLGDLQNQIDGAIDSYFFDYAPATDNYPAMDWASDAQKEAHLGDTFTNNISGESWRWGLDAEGNYAWIYIEDTATKKALAAASKAQDTADGKRRVFTDTPFPPYDEGDLWAGGEDAFLMKCVKVKATGEYDAEDWDYADNANKIKAEMATLVQDTKDELNNAIGQATEAANTYTDKAKAAVEQTIAALDESKANLDAVYTKSEADEKITESEQAAIDAAKKAADAAIALSEETVKAYADGVVDDEEAARIKQAEENLAAAKQYAEAKAQEAFDSAMEELNKFDYLKAALKEDTTIDGGLIQSSLLQLGYTNDANVFNVMSGTNGIYNKDSHGGGVASWWGGGLHDILDYYTWNGQWVAKEGVTIPDNLPSGLIRMDGTGYFAKGKFWWDANGEIHADPTALLLSFDVEAGDETLASTIINIRKDIAAFADMWEIKTDASGNSYLYAKRPIATNGGVTMYADTGDLNIPSIYDGLPIDGSTLYWENGVLKSKVGTEGAITSITSEMVTDALGYTPAKSSDIPSLSGYATENYVTERISDLINGAPAAYDTLKEIADVLAGNVNSIGDILTTLGTKADKATTLAGYGITDAVSWLSNFTTAPLIAGNGTSSYVKMATIVLKKNYNNHPVVFEISGRGYLLAQVTVNWTNANSTDPELNYFYANGHNNFYLVKSAASTWVLYGKMNETWGLYVIQRVLHSRADYDYSISVTPEVVSAIPSGAIQATYHNVASSLYTSRTIWGQSFDGTGNVSGVITSNITGSNPAIQFTNGEYIDGYGNVVLHETKSSNWNIKTTAGSILMNVQRGGNVGINTTSPAYKLDVNGTINTSSNVNIPLGTGNVGITADGKSIIRATTCGLVISPHTENTNGLHFRPCGSTSLVGEAVLNTNGRFQMNELAVVRNSTIGGSLGVTGATSLSSTLSVAGDTTLATKLTLNGIDIYKSQDDVLYIDGNLAVRGGITMYATDAINVDGIIENLPIASTSAKGIASFNASDFSVVDGMVSFIGSGGVDESVLANYAKKTDLSEYLPKSGGTVTGQIGYNFDMGGNIPAAGAIEYSSIDDFAYKKSFIGNGLFTGNNNWYDLISVRTDNGNSLYGLYIATAMTVNGDLSWNKQVNGTWQGERVILDSGNWSNYISVTGGGSFISTSGGRISNTGTGLNINRAMDNANPHITFEANGSAVGDIGVTYDKMSAAFYNYIDGAWFRILDENNFDWYAMSYNNPTCEGTLMINGTNTSGSYPALKFHIPNVDWAQLIMNNYGSLELVSGSSQSGSYKDLGVGTLYTYNDVGVIVKRASGVPYVRFSNGTTNYGEVGVNASNELVLWKFDVGAWCIVPACDVSGNLLVTGGITMYSDIRKKTKLQDVELSLKQIADAPLIEHYYNSDDKRTTHVGSIAQYWAGMNDWFCKLDNEGFYTMEIQNAALASAISIARELVKYESKTDKKIRLLKKRISELEDKIEMLEKK